MNDHNQNEGNDMKLCYIAGAFRHSDEGGIINNVYVAAKVASQVADTSKYNLFPVCPHTLTYQVWQSFSDEIRDEIPDEWWLEGTIKLLSYCDCAVFMPNWDNSEGSKAELEFCKTYAIPFVILTEWSYEHVHDKVDMLLRKING